MKAVSASVHATAIQLGGRVNASTAKALVAPKGSLGAIPKIAGVAQDPEVQARFWPSRAPGATSIVPSLEDAKVPPLPKGLGDAIIQGFGIPPSKRVGDIKRALEASVEAGEIGPHETSEYYVQFLTENKARFGL